MVTYMLEPWLEEVATMLDFSVADTALFVGCLVTTIFILWVNIAARGRNSSIASLITGMFCCLVFVVMGWFPTWMGGIIAFLLAIVTAWYVSQIG